MLNLYKLFLLNMSIFLDTLLLIKEAVQDQRCLYDKSIKDYRNRTAKEKAWAQVSGIDNWPSIF